MPIRFSPERRIRPVHSVCCSVKREAANRSQAPKMPFMGVRISWLMLAMNMAWMRASIALWSAKRWLCSSWRSERLRLREPHINKPITQHKKKLGHHSWANQACCTAEGLIQACTIKSGASVARVNTGARLGAAPSTQPEPNTAAPNSTCRAGDVSVEWVLSASRTKPGSSKATAMPAKVPSL